MGIAATVGAYRPAPRRPRYFHARTRRPRSSPDCPSLRLLFEREPAVAAPHRGIRREAVSPSGLRQVCREEAGSQRDVRASVRSRLCRCRSAETLMRAKMRVVDEAEFDRRGEVFRGGWPQQAEAESVLQRPPQPLDQSDGALLSDRPESLLHPESPQPKAKHLAREAGPSIRHEMRWRSEGFATVRPRRAVLRRENRERPAGREGPKSPPRPLSIAVKCRERLRAVNRSDGSGIGWLTGLRSMASG
jgi:hypothetical protein